MLAVLVLLLVKYNQAAYKDRFHSLSVRYANSREIIWHFSQVLVYVLICSMPLLLDLT